jgi:hypothetical protein
MNKKERELTRILCKWNRKELSPQEAMNRIWRLYEKEALETWNNPLEKLLV